MAAQRKQVRIAFVIEAKTEQEARELSACAAVFKELPHNKQTAGLRSLIHFARCPMEKRALMILYASPELCNADIARALAISKSYVTRFAPILDRFRELHQQTSPPPRGSKSDDGTIESYDNDEQ